MISMFHAPPTRRSAIAAILLAGAGTACRDVAFDFALSRHMTLDDIAERYVRLTLELAQHQPSLVETWLGPDDWRPGPRRPVAEIRKAIDEVAAALTGTRPAHDDLERHRYLDGQMRGLLTAARRLSGESMRLADEARAALGIDALNTDADTSTIAAAREELERRLPGGGPLHERHAAFRVRHALLPERVIPTFREAIKACRERVLRHVALPETERVELTIATGLGVEARAIYEGDFRTRVTLDTSGSVDLARLMWLAAHESYPGHHVQHVLADRDCIRARGWHERALHHVIGGHVFHAEGTAEAGAALLLHGDTFEDVCKELAPVAGVLPVVVADLVAVHRAVAALDILIPSIAQAYLDGEIGSAVAAERLTADALVADGPRFLSVIERQRTRLLAYPIGRRTVAAEMAAGPIDQDWRHLALIATTLTTADLNRKAPALSNRDER